ncbi:MAG TPA: NADH-quinone oxidoreductase subunit K [Bacillota bacterium]|nr:NADH-quinone oxidoreductase subunit K [Bacillota bacterium]
MENYLKVLSIGIVLTTFALVANKRMNSYIKTFQLQSVVLAVLSLLLGISNLYLTGNPEIFIVGLITIGVKVIYIPSLLCKTVAKVEYKVEKDFLWPIPISILMSCGLVVLAYAVVTRVNDLTDGNLRIYLANSIAVVLIGLFFMISRKKAIGQIIGFLVIENGLFTAAILSTEGMPMIVELGIFFDLLTAVLIMGILVFRINENFESIDTDKLKNLRG